GQDAGGVDAFVERIAGEAENLAQEKIGHVAPFEPVQGKGFPGRGKVSTADHGLKLFRKSAKAG
ncbi:MAG: hypothetical protein ACKO1H_13240, partial [Tabrizicola sp.]